ncbi:uncharacterized protein At4g04980-like [Impatiens glandulifera]|uniref:uncharacterized protein At4g04980-like n=1 Tax=Impatiens glandulifera TaxID=253017 RepID=UPI001FB11182|nr:uncharacterized protein At4g04980-like [Impatiens glandulifera]
MVYFSDSPTSVHPEMMMINDTKSLPLFLSPRVHSLEKLNPIDVKQLSFHMIPFLATQVNETVIKEVEESQKDLKNPQQNSKPRPSPPLSATKPPPPPPPGSARTNATKPPPPGPPPPPGSASSNATKLKRSPQIGNLYRLLKETIEGPSLDGKSSRGRKGKSFGSSNGGGKSSMADALAEMTKKSPYFQKIEEDVKNFANTINQLSVQMVNFHSKDMAELLNFHRHVESCLGKLSDESQVLSRFKDFPVEKLEGIRMASALYSKLDGYVNTLTNWKTEPPLYQLFDKADKYFNKMKVDLEALEIKKEEEGKIFKRHNIHFDFSILIKIKESMVNFSNGCMELALREKRERKKKESEDGKSVLKGDNGDVKMLWKAFQFAFRVYTFAGGHDDRAEKLTRELANEIQHKPKR